MIAKTYFEHAGRCRCLASFSLPTTVQARTVHLLGDFNDWSMTSHPLHRDGDGHWRQALELDSGRVYRFRYLIDGARWLHDELADASIHNSSGSKMSVLVTDPAFEQVVGAKGHGRHERLAWGGLQGDDGELDD